METLIWWSCVFGLILSGFFFVAYPFMIGKPKTGSYDGVSYIIGILQCASIVILVGRVWGWW